MARAEPYHHWLGRASLTLAQADITPVCALGAVAETFGLPTYLEPTRVRRRAWREHGAKLPGFSRSLLSGSALYAAYRFRVGFAVALLFGFAFCCVISAAFEAQHSSVYAGVTRHRHTTTVRANNFSISLRLTDRLLIV
jgi:hypothetical protein